MVKDDAYRRTGKAAIEARRLLCRANGCSLVIYQLNCLCVVDRHRTEKPCCAWAIQRKVWWR